MRKSIAIAFCLLAAVSFASTAFDHAEELLTQGYNEVPHHFFGRHFIKEHEGGSHRVVHMPKGGIFSSIDHLKEYNDRLIDATKNPEKYKPSAAAITECSPSNEPHAYKFLANIEGELKDDKTVLKFSAFCFQENEVSLKFVDATTVELTHVMKNKKSLTCAEGFLYSSYANWHMEGFTLAGAHKITFKNMSEEDVESIKEVGMMVFRGCDKLINYYPDIAKTVFLFTGGLGLNPDIPFFGSKVTPEQVKENVRFTKEAMGYEYKKRPEKARKTIYEIPEELIQSGDFFINVRMDGLNQMTQYGSGTHSGHSVMALRVDGELYIMESNAAWYWPREGLQMNPYKDWIKWAHNADYHTTWLPLKKEYADKFDSKKAYDFFKSVEGMPYGYHNFLFGWIDTVNASFPPVMSPELLAAALAMYEKKNPTAVWKVFSSAMQMRLGITDKNLTVSEISRVAAERNISMPELYAEVEQEGWWYPDGYSWVCSAFVARMWMAGGLWDGYTVNPPEFTPRDIYELAFLDPNPTVPDDCKALDPENHLCQIMGEYRMEMPRMGTVEPYSHMNEHCSSQPPLYDRLPAGC